MSKEYSVKKIAKRIGRKVDRTIYGNNTNEDKQNGTATRKFLDQICEHQGIEHSTLDSKTECGKAICKSLEITYDSNYIGTNQQVSAKFLKDIERKL